MMQRKPTTTPSNKKAQFLVSLVPSDVKRLNALNTFHNFPDYAKKSGIFSTLLKDAVELAIDRIYLKENEAIHLTPSEVTFKKLYENIR